MSPVATGRRARVVALLSAVAVSSILALAAATPARAASPAPIDLGGAGAFAVLGATTVTSAGTSTITGDLGVSPGTAVTGFPPAGPGVLNGTMHAGGPVAAAAQADLGTAYDAAVARAKTADAAVLDGLTLGPGVYRSGAALSLAGTLTLDGGGDPNAVFIFQAGSTLGTGAGSSVTLAGGAQACNVFWQVGSSATLAANTALKGSILAHTSVSVGAGSTIDGRVLARGGAVTLDNDTVSVPQCAVPGDLTLPAAPAFSDFPTVLLNGSRQRVTAPVSAWVVDDARGSGAGWQVSMSATVPMPRATLSLAAPVAKRVDPANPSAAPVTAGGIITSGALTVAYAAPGTGRGAWSFAQAASGLTLRVPADARTGAYVSTITTTFGPAL